MFEERSAPYIAPPISPGAAPLTMTETPSKGSPPDRKTIALWRDHWQDESDAAFLYRRLAGSSSDEEKGDLYLKLAAVEEKHTAVWEKIFAEHGVTVPRRKPSSRARLLSWIAGRFGPEMLHSLLLREEGLEVRGYISLYRESDPGSTADAALLLARESARHAETLSKLSGREGEPWHYTRSGGFLRNVVYGFNDGLTANFGLVAGVVGAQAGATFIMLTGVAGMIADALSMGSSGYLAAKSEREVYDHEIAVEEEELRFMPEIEEEELTLLYQTKGVKEELAREIAREIMKSPEQALEVMVQEELGIGEQHVTPVREGCITGVATAVGAFIPVAPFLILSGPAAIWTSFGVSMFSHFAVGAARSIFTGRSMFRSGVDLLVVGFGVAAVGYLVGDLALKYWLG